MCRRSPSAEPKEKFRPNQRMEKLNTGAFWKVAIAQDGFGNLIKRSLGLSNAATDFKVYPMVCCENRTQVLCSPVSQNPINLKINLFVKKVKQKSNQKKQIKMQKKNKKNTKKNKNEKQKKRMRLDLQFVKFYYKYYSYNCNLFRISRQSQLY